MMRPKPPQPNAMQHKQVLASTKQPQQQNISGADGLSKKQASKLIKKTREGRGWTLPKGLSRKPHWVHLNGPQKPSAESRSSAQFIECSPVGLALASANCFRLSASLSRSSCFSFSSLCSSSSYRSTSTAHSLNMPLPWQNSKSCWTAALSTLDHPAGIKTCQKQ